MTPINQNSFFWSPAEQSLLVSLKKKSHSWAEISDALKQSFHVERNVNACTNQWKRLQQNRRLLNSLEKQMPTMENYKSVSKKKFQWSKKAKLTLISLQGHHSWEFIAVKIWQLYGEKRTPVACNNMWHRLKNNPSVFNALKQQIAQAENTAVSTDNIQATQTAIQKEQEAFQDIHSYMENEDLKVKNQCVHENSFFLEDLLNSDIASSWMVNENVVEELGHKRQKINHKSED